MPSWSIASQSAEKASAQVWRTLMKLYHNEGLMSFYRTHEYNLHDIALSLQNSGLKQIIRHKNYNYIFTLQPNFNKSKVRYSRVDRLTTKRKVKNEKRSHKLHYFYKDIIDVKYLKGTTK